MSSVNQPAHLSVVLNPNASVPAVSLPAEIIIIIVECAAKVRPISMLGCAHLCKRWRAIVLGCPALCRLACDTFPNASIIWLFLVAAGSLDPQELDVTALRNISRSGIEHYASRLMGPTEHMLLREARLIRSPLKIDNASWETTLSSVGNFTRLTTLDIVLSQDARPLPVFHAPTLTSLTLRTRGRVGLPIRDLVTFFARYPALVSLFFDKFGCSDTVDTADIIHLPSLRSLELLDTSSVSCLPLLRAFGLNEAHNDLAASLAIEYMDTLTLNDLWPYSDIRDCEHLRLAFKPSRTGMFIFVENAEGERRDSEAFGLMDIVYRPYPFCIAMGPGYLAGDYWYSHAATDERMPFTYERMRSLVQHCAPRVDEVVLDMDYLAADKSTDEIILDRQHHLINLLKILPHPTRLVIRPAASFRGVVDRGNEFLWKTIRSITLDLRTSPTYVYQGLNQHAVDQVTTWLQSPDLLNRVTVRVKGEWWTAGHIWPNTGELQSRSGEFIEQKSAFP